MASVRAGGLYFVGLVVVVAAAGGVAYFWRAGNADIATAREARATAIAAGPRVEVTATIAGPTRRDITLLGDARPYAAVTLYAKVSGYLKSMSVDRGDMVQAGQVIAEIDSAETDSQYASAVADLENKTRLAARNAELLIKGNVSIQVAEQSATDKRVAEGNVRNLGTMKSYEILRAPFAGKVTGRFADPGALVQNATTNQATALPIITLSDSTRLRVTTYVEQRDAPFVHVGDAVEVRDATNASRAVQAKVSRFSGELDPKTRTLYIEMDVDNSASVLVPGSFVYVTIRVPVQSVPQIPASALIMRGEDAFVAGVDAAGTVHFRAVKVGGTDGRTVDIADGIAVGERVAVNLPSEITEGGRIQPIALVARRP
jgi:membrane fusion protein, multidrug efflux system